MRRTISHYCEIDVSEALYDLTDEEIIAECRKREIPLGGIPETDAKAKAKFADAVEQASYEFDSWMHDLRHAFLARDERHFDVLLVRAESRYREYATKQLALERIA